jgi:hypothetical protein
MGLEGMGLISLPKGPEDDCKCCGKHRELQPAGPDGLMICFECAMKVHIESFEKFMAKLIEEQMGHKPGTVDVIEVPIPKSKVNPENN